MNHVTNADKNKFLQEFTSRTDKSVAEKLAGTTAGVAGCGGLGSNIAVSLARAGIGKLILADFDKVDASNLNRQHYFIDDIGKFKVDALSRTLSRINPYIETEKHIVRIDAVNLTDVFSVADIVFEAFDGAEDKSMIISAFLDWEAARDKYLVCASGMAGIGSSNRIVTKRLSQKIYVCGDFESDILAVPGLVSSRVCIAANHQVNAGIRLLLGFSEP